MVLLITFGSQAAAGLPLLTAILGVGVGMSAILALGSALGLSETTGTLATMLGLARGIDFARVAQPPEPPSAGTPVMACISWPIISGRGTPSPLLRMTPTQPVSG